MSLKGLGLALLVFFFDFKKRVYKTKPLLV